MADYTYTQAIGNLKKFLSHVQSAGVPTKVTLKYLVSAGFKSTNDRSIIGVLKSIGFLDSNGTPTDRWKAYRDKSQSSFILATAVRETYSELFKTYPEAQKRDEEALRNFFSAHTTLGAKALGLTVSTFKSLCELSIFDGEPPGTPPVPLTTSSAPIGTAPITTVSTSSSGVVVNINVELTIPATDKGEIYDKFFAAMKKNLLTND